MAKVHMGTNGTGGATRCGRWIDNPEAVTQALAQVTCKACLKAYGGATVVAPEEKRNMAQVSMGSISTGTLRTEDLLEAFASALDERIRATTWADRGDPRAHERLAWEAQNRYYLDDGRDEREEEAAEIVNELIGALNEYCPPFVYFGSHPGDGADYGFWPDVDALEAEMRYAEDTADADTKYLPDANVLVQVSDHGNILVMDVDRRELWSCV